MKLSDVMSAATGLSAYAEVALIIFLGGFLGVVLDLVFAGKRHEAMRLLPLSDPARSGRPRPSDGARP